MHTRTLNPFLKRKALKNYTYNIETLRYIMTNECSRHEFVYVKRV